MPSNDNPCISVILPTYNRADCLSQSIDSVLGQSFSDLELIIIDDGSTDDTGSVVSSYSDDRLRYQKLAQNSGLSAARNVGLDNAQGRYLAFQDSDDEWVPGKLEAALDAFEQHPEAAVAYSDMIRQLKDGSRMYFRSPDISRGRLINPDTGYWQSYMLAMQPCLIRRDRLGKIRFDEKLRFFEDLDFHLQLAMDHEYVHICEPYVIYHESDGMTADVSSQLVARRQMLSKYAALLRRQAPAFFIREGVNTLLRRSLMPIVRQHLVPM